MKKIKLIFKISQNPLDVASLWLFDFYLKYIFQLLEWTTCLKHHKIFSELRFFDILPISTNSYHLLFHRAHLVVLDLLEAYTKYLNFSGITSPSRSEITRLRNSVNKSSSPRISLKLSKDSRTYIVNLVSSDNYYWSATFI